MPCLNRVSSWLAPLTFSATLVFLLGCDKDTSSPTAPEAEPTLATTSTNALLFLEVNAGGHYTCGVAIDSLAYCWGNNAEGMLGDGTTIDRSRPTPVARGLHFLQVSPGVQHTCGVTTRNWVYCWGLNNRGQLGSSGYRRLYPVIVPRIQFREVNTGEVHTCAVTPSNVAYCWGNNSWGQLGDGTRIDRATPIPVAGGLRFRRVIAGSTHTCGVTTADRVYCWGENVFGELGDGTTTDRLRPVAVVGGQSFRQVLAGGTGHLGHTCGLTSGQRVYCWGNNRDGKLGDGSLAEGRLTPVAVTGGFTFSQIAPGGGHTCGIVVLNKAYCWGDNFVGGLGDGTATDRSTPVAVVGGLRFSGVSSGNWHTCGKTTAKLVYCWGHNSWGQLGTGTTIGPETCRGSSCSTRPVAVVGRG